MCIPLPVLLVIDMFLENEDILQEINKHFEYNSLEKYQIQSRKKKSSSEKIELL